MLRPAHLLRNEKLASAITAHPVRLTILICLVWILPGLAGHDPWKPDEAQTFGVVFHLIQSHDWVVPMLAGEPYLEKPPLVYLSAALFGTLLSPFLPLHDAARLVSGAYMGLTFLFIGLAGIELYGRRKSWIAPLMLLGCGGLLLRAHQLVTDVGLVCGMAMAFYAFALAARRPVLAGFWLGTGLGIGVYSTGLVEPLMPILVAAILPIVSPHWRTRAYALTVAVGLAVLVPWAIGWPLALHARAPELFSQWFWTENVLRLKGMFVLGPEDETFYHLRNLAWFAWPALPFALWSLYSEGRAGLGKPGVVLPVVAFLVFLVFISALGEGREIFGLPMLLPLSLLAAAGIEKLPRGATNAYYWFAIMLFTFFALLGWFYWSGIDLGVPARLHRHMMKLQPDYFVHAHPLAVAAALLVTLAWFVLLFNVKRTPERPVAIWAAGVTMIWALIGLLLVNYIDTGKTYRTMVMQLTAALPPRHGCIYSQSLGEPQRAMLHYFGNVTTERLEKNGPRPDCDLLITQDNWKTPGRLGPPWKLVWQGRRPGDKQERYRLYRQVGN
ncbi:MAG TPA: glycosyltransferase family 39 protein [Burkholderiales bacterium]|nr:glycosyltransferase family 39 protein [Burkholderiales bacterium]